MAKNERKTRTKRAIFVVIALLLVAYLISSTYARYTTSGTGTGTVQVAKWNVVMKADDNTVVTDTTEPITFTVQNNTNVVPGKIAPAVTAKAKVELDLTGTEVAVDFDAVINQANIATVFGDSASDVTLTVEVDGKAYTSGTSQTIPLENKAAFTATNGKKKVTLTLTWTNNEDHNENDTALGKAAPTLTIPVTLTAKQHI